MKITHEITLDMKKTGQRQVIEVKQGDALSRELAITLYEGGTVWPVPEDATILQVAYYKPDRTGGLYDTLPDGSVACTVNENVITVQLHPQMFTASGMVLCELRLLNEIGAQLSTFCWYMQVSASATNGIKSEDYYNFASLEAMRKDLGLLSDLQTLVKSSLVAAINEVLNKAALGCFTTEQQAALMREFSAKAVSILDADAVGVPVVNSMDDIDGNLGIARIIRSAEEESKQDAAGNVTIPSLEKVAELIEESTSDRDSGVFIQIDEPEDAEDGALWIDENEESDIPSGAVNSVNGKTGAVVLSAADVGAATKEEVLEAIAKALSAIGVAEEGAY